jgi:hypothetical protein
MVKRLLYEILKKKQRLINNIKQITSLVFIILEELLTVVNSYKV